MREAPAEPTASGKPWRAGPRYIKTYARRSSEKEPLRLRKVCWREKGKRHGLTTHHDPAGGYVTRVECYDHGELHGPQIETEGGIIRSFEVFVHGARVPLWMDWNTTSGELATQCSRLSVAPPSSTAVPAPSSAAEVHLADPATLGGRWLRLTIMGADGEPMERRQLLPGYDPSRFQMSSWDPYGTQQYTEAFIEHHLRPPAPPHSPPRAPIFEVEPILPKNPSDPHRQPKGAFPPESAVERNEYRVWQFNVPTEGYKVVECEGLPRRFVGVGYTDPNVVHGGVRYGDVAKRHPPCVRLVVPRERTVYLVPHSMKLGELHYTWRDLAAQNGIECPADTVLLRPNHHGRTFGWDDRPQILLHDRFTKTVVVAHADDVQTTHPASDVQMEDAGGELGGELGGEAKGELGGDGEGKGEDEEMDDVARQEVDDYQQKVRALQAEYEHDFKKALEWDTGMHGRWVIYYKGEVWGRRGGFTDSGDALDAFQRELGGPIDEPFYITRVGYSDNPRHPQGK